MELQRLQKGMGQMHLLLHREQHTNRCGVSMMVAAAAGTSGGGSQQQDSSRCGVRMMVVVAAGTSRGGGQQQDSSRWGRHQRNSLFPASSRLGRWFGTSQRTSRGSRSRLHLWTRALNPRGIAFISKEWSATRIRAGCFFTGLYLMWWRGKSRWEGQHNHHHHKNLLERQRQQPMRMRGALKLEVAVALGQWNEVGGLGQVWVHQHVLHQDEEVYRRGEMYSRGQA